jgi:hypothetical protein
MDDDQRQRQNLMVAIAAVILVALGAWGLIALKHSSARLDCEAAHLRNCDQLP